MLNTVDLFSRFGRPLLALAVAFYSLTKSRAVLQMENLALRQQLLVLRRTSPKRPRLNAADRLFWVSISELCAEWRSWLLIVQPETVVGWHRKLFRAFWTWKIGHGKAGRPRIPKETRELIRRLCCITRKAN